MSCEYCKHETIAYRHWMDADGCDNYDRVAEVIPYDDCDIDDADPVISWWLDPRSVDWAGHLPRLCISAYDADGDEECISIPIRYCPMCGRKLPKAGSEADG